MTSDPSLSTARFFTSPRESIHLRSELKRSGLAPSARTVLDCLFTKHHDGYVREKYLRAVINAQFAWVPPFVIQLLGEYVVQIHR